MFEPNIIHRLKIGVFAVLLHPSTSKAVNLTVASAGISEQVQYDSQAAYAEGGQISDVVTAARCIAEAIPDPQNNHEISLRPIRDLKPKSDEQNVLPPLRAEVLALVNAVTASLFIEVSSSCSSFLIFSTRSTMSLSTELPTCFREDISTSEGTETVPSI